MPYRRVFAVLFMFTLVCCAAIAQTQPAAAQPASPAPPSNAVASEGASSADDTLPVQTFHSRSDEVNVIFTVTDKHNKFIKDLKQNQFKILDNNRPPRQILDFSAETDLPLRVGLLIDASNSTAFCLSRTPRFHFCIRSSAPKLTRHLCWPLTRSGT
jgi:hypothetical protein